MRGINAILLLHAGNIVYVMYILMFDNIVHKRTFYLLGRA